MGLAVTRTIKIFELLSKEPLGLTLSEISVRINASKSTLAPMLKDLVDSKYLLKSNRRKFLIGPKFTLISQSRLNPNSHHHIGTIRLMGILIEEVRILFGAHGVTAFSWDSEQQLLCPTYSYSQLLHESVQLRPGEGLAGQVWSRNQPLLVNDYANWEYALPGFRSSEWRCHMGAIIRQDLERVGVIVVRAHDKSLVFSEGDLEKLISLTDDLAEVTVSTQ